MIEPDEVTTENIKATPSGADTHFSYTVTHPDDLSAEPSVHAVYTSDEDQYLYLYVDAGNDIELAVDITADDTEGAPVAQAAVEPEKKESESPDNNQSNQSPVMKKVFLMVAAVLAAASQAALPEEADKDGKYSVDGAQLDAIEAALAAAKTEKEALETAKANLQGQLDAANARITELEALPAAKDEHVVETGKKAPQGDSPLDTMQANIAEARKMLGKD